MSRYDNDTYEKLIGRKVVGVETTNPEQVKLTLDDGKVATFGLEGDCCSHSYFTDPKQFDELVGSTIQKAEERYGETNWYADESIVDPALKDRELKLDAAARAGDEYGDSVSWHFFVFETNQGHVTIDWRNDSNGYYDGYILFSVN